MVLPKQFAMCIYRNFVYGFIPLVCFFFYFFLVSRFVSTTRPAFSCARNVFFFPREVLRLPPAIVTVQMLRLLCFCCVRRSIHLRNLFLFFFASYVRAICWCCCDQGSSILFLDMSLAHQQWELMYPLIAPACDVLKVFGVSHDTSECTFSHAFPPNAEYYGRVSSMSTTAPERGDMSSSSLLFPLEDGGLHRSCLRYPDAKDVSGSFYKTRHEAMVSWNFLQASRSCQAGSDLADETRIIPIAVDKPGGSEAKVFQCIELRDLPLFLQSFRRSSDRNVYALVSDAHPVTPYFDVDGLLSRLPAQYVDNVKAAFTGFPSAMQTTSPHAFAHVCLDSVLRDVLAFLEEKLVAFFQHKCGDGEFANIRQVLVTSSSACTEGKISYHLHFSLAAMATTGTDTQDRSSFVRELAFSSVAEHKLFADSIAKDLSISTDVSLAAMLRTVLDLSVYTRWRALRLPYCIKSVNIEKLLDGAKDSTATAASKEPLLLSQRLAFDDEVQSTLQRVAHVGSCLRASPCVGCHEGNAAISSAFPGVVLRPLIPYCPSSSASPAFDICLRLHVLGAELDDASSIHEDQREKAVREILRAAVITLPVKSRALTKRRRVGDEEEEEVIGDSEVLGSSECVSSGAFFPTARRMVMSSMVIKRAIWEVLQHLHPVAFLCLRPEQLTVHYEDAGQRYYYVYQKQSRWCLNLGRDHRQTFGQFYLTYGSVKFRCYSNDCCHNACWKKPWDGDAQVNRDPEPPCGLRSLLELRARLFPELSPEQLASRYPSFVLTRTTSDLQSRSAEQPPLEPQRDVIVHPDTNTTPLPT